MRATVLLGTLKRDGLSNTETLTEFLAGRFERAGITCGVVKLVTHDIHPGTETDMGAGDAWPVIYAELEASDIIVFASPIWWSNVSSEIQRAIERLDAVHDVTMAGKPSPLEGKAAGFVITGDSDGAQHLIGMLANFAIAIGMTVPPYASLSVLWDGHAKGKDTPKAELLAKYESDYSSTADEMVRRLVAAATR